VEGARKSGLSGLLLGVVEGAWESGLLLGVVEGAMESSLLHNYSTLCNYRN